MYFNFFNGQIVVNVFTPLHYYTKRCSYMYTLCTLLSVKQGAQHIHHLKRGVGETGQQGQCRS
jgi:hypothetical protein